MKFLIPIAGLTAIGSTAMPWLSPRFVEAPAVITTVWSFTKPFALGPPGPVAPPTPPARQVATLPVAPALLMVWVAGSVIVAVRYAAAAERTRRRRRTSRPVERGREIEALARVAGPVTSAALAVRSSPHRDAPCVVGVIRPALVWPEGVTDALSDAQLDAIVRHELAHVRRRDNLAGAVHGAVEVIFWFHPMVWWLGSRLVAERERACDENVLASGTAPADYANAILAVCQRSLGAAVAGSAGIGGSVLARRMEVIMSATVPKSPGSFLKMGLALTAFLLVLGPLVVGALRAQAPSMGARITGVVTDQFAGVVPGATVTVTGNATGTMPPAVTDAFGRYTIAGVAAGSYELRVTIDGFRPSVIAVTVGAGSQVTADARLRLGEVTESITLAAVLNGASPGSRPSASDAEAAFARQLAERPDDVDAQLGLAELLYRDERFGESAVAMERASALWVARQRPASSPTAASGDIRPPKMARRVDPIYPETARAAGVTGTVILQGTITEDGTVEDLRVVRGVPLLNDAALGAVRQWLYEPTRLNGVPVAVTMTTNISFAVN
jgi:TonB family protein